MRARSSVAGDRFPLLDGDSADREVGRRGYQLNAVDIDTTIEFSRHRPQSLRGHQRPFESTTM